MAFNEWFVCPPVSPSSARKKLEKQASCLFVECTGRMPNATHFSWGNRGTVYRGTDKNDAPLSCGRDAHAPFYCCPQRSAGILPAGAETAPPPYHPGSADVLVGKKYVAGGQGRRGRRRSQGISQSPATRCGRKEGEKGCEKLVALGILPAGAETRLRQGYGEAGSFALHFQSGFASWRARLRRAVAYLSAIHVCPPVTSW
jgi:hypothetical protein